MVVDNILGNIPTPVFTFAGSTFCGFFCGTVLRKILKIVVIIAGIAFGLFFLGIQYMSTKGYLGNDQINWDRVGNDTSVAFQHLYTFFSSQHIFTTLGVPATTGFAAGITIGLVRGL